MREGGVAKPETLKLHNLGKEGRQSTQPIEEGIAQLRKDAESWATNGYTNKCVRWLPNCPN